jgi:opacity protein-like surface antigen
MYFETKSVPRTAAALSARSRTLKAATIAGALASVLSVPSLARAQALPTASAKASLQAGGGVTYAMPDYGEKSIEGITGFADLDLGRHVGVEADIHYIAIITPTDLAENSYLIGPRFILPYRRFKFYAKGLFGVGDLVIQEQSDNLGRQSGTDFAYALGAGVEYQATSHLVVRAIDFETQHWNYLTGLTPTVVTVGVAYRFR